MLRDVSRPLMIFLSAHFVNQIIRCKKKLIALQVAYSINPFFHHTSKNKGSARWLTP